MTSPQHPRVDMPEITQILTVLKHQWPIAEIKLRALVDTYEQAVKERDSLVESLILAKKQRDQFNVERDALEKMAVSSGDKIAELTYQLNEARAELAEALKGKRNAQAQSQMLFDERNYYADKFEALEVRSAKLVEALRWYAREGFDTGDWVMDEGKVARAALAEWADSKGESK